ncbi:MAG: hypothetical protein LBQ09_03170 [Acidobacteriaceae bacterium]|jgi:hypothetical protein|nr:hypothetical protein [Acidobacteriaceae bacterium]
MKKSTASLLTLALTLTLPLSLRAAPQAPAAPAAATADAATGPHAAFGGVWVLVPPERGSTPDGTTGGSTDPGAGGYGGGRGGRGGGGGGGGYGGGRGGGGGGFGRGGGGFGRGGGGFGGGRGGRGGGGGDPQQMAAISNYMRSLNEQIDRMTIAVHDTTLSLAYADGRVQTLQADNKTVDEKAENGLVKIKRKTHWDGAALLVTFDIDNGPKIERRYELTPDGTELHISQTISGGNGRQNNNGRVPPPIVYMHPPEE